jgi:predicted DNA-binding transcriptional regulator YafY
MNNLFLKSKNENLPLEIIYLSEDQQFSQRKLIVKEINDDYILAYCLLRKQMRTFRVENILSIMPDLRSSKFLH